MSLDRKLLKEEELKQVSGGARHSGINISMLSEFHSGMVFTNGVSTIVCREYMYPINGDRMIQFDSYSSGDLTAENYTGIVIMCWNEMFEQGFTYTETKMENNYIPR